MAVGGSGERSLKETPTWAVALVCTVFILLSILIEHGIHILGKVRNLYTLHTHNFYFFWRWIFEIRSADVMIKGLAN